MMMVLFKFSIIMLSLSVPWIIVSLGSLAAGSTRILMVLGAWPLIAVVESMILIAYPDAAVIILGINLACFVLAFLVKKPRPESSDAGLKELYGICAATCLVAMPMVFFWLADTDLRMFGWHHLLQLEAMYSAVENQGGDLGYFGKKLAYPYLGLLPLAALSRILDVSPTLVYPALNILTIFVWVGSLHVWIRKTRTDASGLQVAASTTLVMLCSGLLVYVAMSVLSPSGHHIYLETRSVPLIAKHRHIDAMTIGLMSLSLQYLCALLQGKGHKGFRMLEVYFGVQTCVTYPALGPVAVLFSGMLAMRTALPKLKQRPLSSLLEFASPTVVGLSLLLTMWFLGSDKGSGGVGMFTEPKRLVIGVINLGLTLGLTAAIAYFTIRKQPRMEKFLIGLALLCLAGMFIVLSLPADIQYKFLYGASILLAFYAASTLVGFVTDLPGKPFLANARWVMPVLAVASVTLAIIQLADRQPRMNAMPVMNEQSFLVTSRLGEDVNRILEAQRLDRTSLVLVSDVDEPAVPFMRIPQYFYGGKVQVGYSMDADFIATGVKGYSVSEYREREKTISAMLSQCENMPGQFSQHLGGRQVVFLLAGQNACLSAGPSSRHYQEHRLADGKYLYLALPGT